MSLSEKIYFFIFSLVGIPAIIYWGNIVWRHPDKFRKTLVFDGGRWFVFYLWAYRIFILLFGLALLFITVMMILDSIGIV